MPQAARITDLHECPVSSPGQFPIPHIGGPIVGPGEPTVLIGGLPAASVGDLVICVGPQNSIVEGSASVFIGGLPAARIGDKTAHGGKIVAGAVNVFIGG